MRAGTVQINWHDTKPVLSCDFHPISGILATAGADCDIKLWTLISGIDLKKDPGVTYQNNLSSHSSAVNALRFSPSGDYLASGADGGEMILWKSHKTDAGEVWKVFKSLMFHRKDVLDIYWSSDGAYVISGSVDNSCVIWDANKGSVHQILDGHAHYVQGVAWDPLGKYVASLSSDRTLRIYANKPSKTKGVGKLNFVCQDVISKSEWQATDESKISLVAGWIISCGSCRYAAGVRKKFLINVHLICRSIQEHGVFGMDQQPAVVLPGASKAVVAIRFCPVKFQLLGTNACPVFKIPYRVVFAVGSLNSVYVYDTESAEPIVVVGGVHYAAITDISWSGDGRYLCASSQDGYCTVVEFEKGEIGEEAEGGG
ncbi:hypothetical protein M569_03161 [Genlisea aurea]|uniref:CAF-1 p60 homolog n=1 Tax=Genlisea aurea TaxID=192259 RepID=S8EG19_9LAMI|nr:hypothetical protein M569_03161 [Genlisea aurea]